MLYQKRYKTFDISRQAKFETFEKRPILSLQSEIQFRCPTELVLNPTNVGKHCSKVSFDSTNAAIKV